MKNAGGITLNSEAMGLDYATEQDALHLQDDGHFIRYNRVIRWLEAQGINHLSRTALPVIPSLMTFIRRGHRG